MHEGHAFEGPSPGGILASRLPRLASIARIEWIALASVLLFGAALRLYGLNWDGGHHLHPDERFITMVTQAVALPASPLDYFNTATSSLNPYNRGFDGFAYGTLPLFVTRAVAELLGQTGYDRVHLLGRALSALADLGTVLFVFLLGRAIYGTRVGLLAALLLAATVLHVQLSHFYAFDTFVAFFLAASLYVAHHAWYRRGWSSFLLLGFLFGCAVAAKISSLIFLPILLGAALLPSPRAAIAPASPADSSPGPAVPAEPNEASAAGRPRAGYDLLDRLAEAGVGVVGAFVAFRLFEPYAFLGPTIFGIQPNPQFIADMDRWIKISSGVVDVPYMLQWALRPPILFSLEGIVLWGLGLPLGLTAFGGFAFAAWELRDWSRGARHALLAAWVALNLLYFGTQFAKFLRYLLPIYPALALFAAYLLVHLVDRARARASRPLAVAAGGLAAGVLIGTVLYALAFANLYSRPVSRVTASEWIYASIPHGSVLATEHWDDSLPLGLPGRDPGAYRYVSLTLYDEDNPDKLRRLVEALQQADYIILSSNRLWGSIPRVPERYPMGAEYYRRLFSGELGFERVATFQERPGLFGVTIDDSGAQEDFTVYDHPTVMVFRKTPDFSPERVRALLEPALERGPIRLRAVDAGRHGLMLTPDEARANQSGGTWRELFDPEGPANRLPVLAWLLTVQALGLVAFPIARRLFPNLADRGYGVSKVLGLLAVAYLSWLAASLQIVPFSRTSVWAALSLLAVVALALHTQERREVGEFFRRNRGLVVASELVFLGGFGLFLGIRLANPDLWHSSFGGEKPMDFAYLNAIVRTSYFPPYDPWFAGGSINYYYFGFVLVAALIKLSGVVPAVAYNLAIPLFFALVVAGAFSFAFNWTAGRQGIRTPRHWRLALLSGLAASTFVGLIGNLDGGLQLLEGLARLGSGGQGVSAGPALLVQALAGVLALAGGASLPPFDFWRSTRVIGPEDPGPISEFPFFTFLYGDLHAHLLALPLTLATLVLALELARQRSWRTGRVWTTLPHLALGGLLLGALRAANTWDFPTYLLVLVGAIGAALAPRRRDEWAPALLRLGLGGALLFGLASLLFAPYLERYQLFYQGVEAVRARTALGQFLTIHGFFLFLAASLLALQAYLAWRRSTAESPVLVPKAGPYYGLIVPAAGLDLARAAGLWAPVGGGALALGLLAAGRPVPALLALLLGLVVLAALQSWRSPDRLLLVVAVAVALVILAVPEFVALSGDIGRMNTVFKFYLQAWVLLALAGATGLTVVLRGLDRLRLPPSGRRVWLGALGLLLAATLVYPLLGTPAKVRLRFADLPPTLDGMAFMRTAVYQDRDDRAGRDRAVPLGPDYQAIRWLQENVDGSPILVEAQTPLYRWGSRVSIYTGLPTVIGWDWHQKQQRGDFGYLVDERSRDVRRIYETTDPEEALRLLRKYGVEYVYVGPLETTYYPASGIEKFRQLVGRDLRVVYEREGVVIYQRVGAAAGRGSGAEG